jgi:hypothetical protein
MPLDVKISFHERRKGQTEIFSTVAEPLPDPNHFQDLHLPSPIQKTHFNFLGRRIFPKRIHAIPRLPDDPLKVNTKNRKAQGRKKFALRSRDSRLGVFIPADVPQGGKSAKGGTPAHNPSIPERSNSGRSPGRAGGLLRASDSMAVTRRGRNCGKNGVKMAIIVNRGTKQVTFSLYFLFCWSKKEWLKSFLSTVEAIKPSGIKSEISRTGPIYFFSPFFLIIGLICASLKITHYSYFSWLLRE